MRILFLFLRIILNATNRVLLVVFSISFLGLFAEEADQIFYGGDIVTVNDEMPSAEAVAVANGKIIFVGKEVDVFSYKNEKTQMIDLQGAALLPGFIDAHTHMILEALIQSGVDVSPFRFKRIGQVIRVLKRAVKSGPVLAFGYDPSLMTRPGTMGFDLLDRISTEVPILVINKSGRFAYGNHKAFELAGLSDEMSNPLGGSFERDAEGHLTGVAEEVSALALLFTPVAKLLKLDYAELARQAASLYAKQGYTTITDLSMGFPMPTPIGNIRLLHQLAEDSECPLRIQGYVSFSMLSSIAALQKQFNSDRWQLKIR